MAPRAGVGIGPRDAIEIPRKDQRFDLSDSGALVRVAHVPLTPVLAEVRELQGPAAITYRNVATETDCYGSCSYCK